jgi:hypothetical protein
MLIRAAVKNSPSASRKRASRAGDSLLVALVGCRPVASVSRRAYSHRRTSRLYCKYAEPK